MLHESDKNKFWNSIILIICQRNNKGDRCRSIQYSGMNFIVAKGSFQFYNLSVAFLGR